MTDPRFYKRVWKVTAFRPQGTFDTGPQTVPSFDLGVPNGIEITGLRVQFKIEKNLQKHPNTCEVSITNLRESTRTDICQKPIQIRIDAGHEENGGARLLFGGDLRYGYSKQDRTEWETVLQIADGSRAFSTSRVNRTYHAGTDVLTALKEVAGSMGQSLPQHLELSNDLKRQFTGGIALQGWARDEMTRLLTPYGYTWSMQDGKIQILRDDEVRQDRAIIISQETGMLGSPEFASPTQSENKKGKSPTLNVKTILYPQLNPGAMLNVQGRGINGIFRAEKVRHVGDTHGDDWFTEIEARAADGFKAV